MSVIITIIVSLMIIGAFLAALSMIAEVIGFDCWETLKTIGVAMVLLGLTLAFFGIMIYCLYLIWRMI